MHYLGIDPGKSGGIALLDEDFSVVFAIPMPPTMSDINDVMKHLPDDTRAIIERVSSMPGQGVASTFKFGKGFGALLMSLIANEIPFEQASPQKWMKYYSMKKSKTESKTQWKNRLKGKAQEMFPKVKITLALSDALLIARYCHAWYSNSD